MFSRWFAIHISRWVSICIAPEEDSTGRGRDSSCKQRHRFWPGEHSEACSLAKALRNTAVATSRRHTCRGYFHSEVISWEWEWVITSAALIHDEWLITLEWEQQQREPLCSSLSPLLWPLEIKTADLCLPLRLACNSLRVLLWLYRTGTIPQQIFRSKEQGRKGRGKQDEGYSAYIYLTAIH